LLGVGVAVNLLLIGYFKYAGFAVENWNLLTGGSVALGDIILPLGISFYTFQQIAYLVNSSRGETHGTTFLQYCLFVVFFPQLIAGPIIHPGLVLPQFADRRVFQPNYSNLAIGLTYFALGLFKKVVLADSIAVHATPAFHAAALDEPLTLLEAWGGALAYTLQLYFDSEVYRQRVSALAVDRERRDDVLALKSLAYADLTAPGAGCSASGPVSGRNFDGITGMRAAGPSTRKMRAMPAWISPAVRVPGGRHGAGSARPGM
jgi:hypothetical protein